MESITVRVDPKLVKLARSPFFWIVGALQGVAASFAPLFLYWSGKGLFFGMDLIVAGVCFVIIFGVSVFHYQFSGPLLRALRQA